MAMFLLLLFGLLGKSAAQDNWKRVSDLDPDKYVTIGSLATSPVEVKTIVPSTADSEKPDQHYLVMKFCATDCFAANLYRVDVVLTDMFNPNFLSYKIKYKGFNLGGATGRRPRPRFWARPTPWAKPRQEPWNQAPSSVS